ncbi:MAG: hypothetical protein LC650_04010 [Actinobacteria bacterium]|nr:hypothetical protein [Actinomycetota bacterium]
MVTLQKMVTLYTTAPEAYDYSYVRRSEKPVGEMVLFQGTLPIYRVLMPEESVDYQCGRYASGMYAVMDIERLMEEEGYGFLVRFED